MDTGQSRYRPIFSPMANVLADELDRYYSFFDLKRINWRERTAQYQPADQGAKSVDDLLTLGARQVAPGSGIA